MTTGEDASTLPPKYRAKASASSATLKSMRRSTPAPQSWQVKLDGSKRRSSSHIRIAAIFSESSCGCSRISTVRISPAQAVTPDA